MSSATILVFADVNWGLLNGVMWELLSLSPFKSLRVALMSPIPPRIQYFFHIIAVYSFVFIFNFFILK